MPENSTCSSAASCSKESCEGCKSNPKNAKENFQTACNAHSSIKKVIGVISGKGGVGKSFVTGHLAAGLRRMGYAIGVMDADITGPSIPKMYGVTGTAYGNEEGEILPLETADGIGFDWSVFRRGSIRMHPAVRISSSKKIYFSIKKNSVDFLTN